MNIWIFFSTINYDVDGGGGGGQNKKATKCRITNVENQNAKFYKGIETWVFAPSSNSKIPICLQFDSLIKPLIFQT